MEGHDRPLADHEQLTEENGDWVYEQVGGRWKQVLRPKLQFLDVRGHEERERRAANFTKMYEDTARQWGLDDPEVAHNEGILRDHPRYRELFEKWALRFLRHQGYGRKVFSDRIDPIEGRLFGPDERPIDKWLVNEVANGREWIDENIEMELRISEGFLDVTHDDERQRELGVEPARAGWWTQDEI